MNKYNSRFNLTKVKIRSVVSPGIWAIGLLYTLYSHFNECPRSIILGAWLIGPPLWLYLEYQFFFDKAADDWKLFQYKQLLQRNLWLGVVAFLAVKYLPLS